MADDEVLRQASQGGADRAHRMIGRVDEWLFGEAMADLLALFELELPKADATDAPSTADLSLYDEELPPWVRRVLSDATAQQAGLSADQLDLLRRVLTLERITADRFNFRARGGAQYVERSAATIATFGSAESRRIVELADRLGLVSLKPPRFTAYAATLVLGGGYSRPLLRARHARKLQEDGVDLGRLSFLGSARRLIDKPDERPAADEYAPGAVDEFDLLIGAAQTVFALSAGPSRFLCGCESADEVCPRWRRQHGEFDGEMPAAFTHERESDLSDARGKSVGSVLSASTGRPPRRPNTADTLALWARTARVHTDDRLLVVTSQFFVPFQTFDCFRLLGLPYGLEVDTVGFDDAPSRPAELPGYLLMETHSAIRSARRLLVAALELLSGADDEAAAPSAAQAGAPRAGG